MKRRNFLSMLPLFGMFSTVAASSSGDNKVVPGEACSDLRLSFHDDHKRPVRCCAASMLRVLKQDKRRFALWYCELNCWEWPKDWGPIPEEFRRMQQLPAHTRTAEFTRQGYDEVMDVLLELGGYKEFLRVWNTEYRQGPDKMTEAEFEKWWLKPGYLSQPDFLS